MDKKIIKRQPREPGRVKKLLPIKIWEDQFKELRQFSDQYKVSIGWMVTKMIDDYLKKLRRKTNKL